ncbi:MAG TPA: C40 family peptidase [Gemmatimonadaceae bacterium]|nr:C40 family peptidase [Gemmatimonadaceae bacterium]
MIRISFSLRRRRPLGFALAAGLALALAGQAEAQSRSGASRPRPLPIIGSVRIGGNDDAAHPYTNRAALATRSRRALASLDLPSLANVDMAARNVLLAARGFMGTPYVWGGETPGGFDCSGFTKYVFSLTGVALPRNSRQQLASGMAVPTSLSALAPGDLIFFAASPRQPVSHVGIYAGEGRMIHASGRGRVVMVDDLRSGSGRWYVDHMVAVRRILPTPATAVAQ